MIPWCAAKATVISTAAIEQIKSGKIVSEEKEREMRDGVTECDANELLVREALADSFLAAGAQERRKCELSGMYDGLTVKKGQDFGGLTRIC
jgi:hypothetical protein